MKVFVTGLLLIMCLLQGYHCQKNDNSWLRDRRQTSADQMVQNILQWLQGVYSQNSRKIRQGTLREYLPPSNTQKPRPFETPTPTQRPTTEQQNGVTPQSPFPTYTNPATGGITGEGGGYPAPDNEIAPPNQHGTSYPQPTGYPQPSTPKPSFTEGYPHGFPTEPPPGYPGTHPPGGPVTGYPGPSTGYPGTHPPGGPATGYPGPSTGYPATHPPGGPVTGYPGPSTGYPATHPPGGPVTGYPGPSTGYPGGISTGGYPNPSTGYPQPTTPAYPQTTTAKPGFPTHPPTGYPQQSTTGYPEQPTTGYPQQSTTGYPQHPKTGYPQHPTTGYPEQSTTTTVKPALPTQPPTQAGGITTTTQPEIYTSQPGTITTQSPDDNNVIPVETTVGTGGEVKATTEPATSTDEDLKHPPHIHAIDVECAKDMMTINIEFNREFNGVIYSKGYYNQPECRYVNAGSEKKKYTFTVSLNNCGTEFVNAFDTQGQSYLENVLVLQNEPGIQEVWDTIRSVRCLWEGNLKESLSVALSVGMLNQEIVTFSGDTAMAKLDIIVGRGPFGQPADGLVKIGEPMTLAVSVSGDPGFDIQVKDCRATDSTGDNVVPLTDENGCILKPKLFGAFQKTRETGNTGASIIAYAYFNAFKFPDVMDLMIECNIELCKTDCDMCPNADQQLEPAKKRKRRDLAYYHNQTLNENEITMGKHLRVILPQDLNGEDGKTAVILNEQVDNGGICMSVQNFIFSSSILIVLLTGSCLMSAYFWLKYHRLQHKF